MDEDDNVKSGLRGLIQGDKSGIAEMHKHFDLNKLVFVCFIYENVISDQIGIKAALPSRETSCSCQHA